MVRLRVVPILLAATFAAAAQSAAGGQIVNVNVVATDNHGKPVNDLTASDLYVTDAGKPEDILFFRRTDRRLPAPLQLVPGEYSNRSAATIPHATVILFDFMNERFTTRAQASNALVHYLQSLESADYLYLYFLTIDGGVVSVRGLGSEEPSGGQPWTKDAGPLVEQATNAVLKVRPPDLDVWTRVMLTYRALDALGAELARVPGRKNIVWITDGVPIDLGPIRSGTGQTIDFTPQLKQLSTALEQSGIAIYPVQQILIGGGGTSAGLGSRETLDQMAAMTGGRPDEGRDIGSAITQAMNDARMSYKLGYAPAPDSWNSKFHKIKVVCRRKGVRIQAKSGYYATPEAPGLPAIAAVRTIARDPMDASEIGLRGTISPVSGARNTVHVDVHIDAADVITIAAGDKNTGRLSAAIMPYGAEGPAAGLAEIPPMIPVDFALTPQNRDSVLKDGIRFEKDVQVPAEVKQIRVAIYDDLGQAVGSLTMPVKSPVSASESK